MSFAHISLRGTDSLNNQTVWQLNLDYTKVFYLDLAFS